MIVKINTNSPYQMIHEPQTHFGFQNVSPREKTRLVTEVFERVAGSYDLMNDIMSLGIHHLWKSTLVNLMRPRDHVTLLDVAGGTGDVAIKFLKYCQQLDAYNVQATVCDRNNNMVAHGRDKAINQGMVNNLNWLVGDAMNLPCHNDMFDIYSIAFGLRNITDPHGALVEAWRVLKPGGTFYCLEFSKVKNSLLKKMYKLYSFKIIPKLGHLIARDQAAYQYLVESIDQFPDAHTLEHMLVQAGFQQTSYQLLNNGIAAIHIGIK